MNSPNLSPEERPDQNDDEPRVDWYVFAVFLVENRLLVLGGIGLFVFALGSVFGLDLPRNLRIIGLAVCLLAPVVGKPFARRIRQMLFDPNIIFIVDVDAREPSAAGLYSAPSQQFRELEVTEGSLDWVHPGLVFAKNVDLEAGTLEGTWRGTLSDRELLKTLNAVAECRGQLENDAKRGFAIESQAFTVIRSATRSAVNSLVSTFERGTLPDRGEGINAAIDKAIDDFGLDAHLDDLDDENSPSGNEEGALDLEAPAVTEVPADD